MLYNIVILPGGKTFVLRN